MRWITWKKVIMTCMLLSLLVFPASIFAGDDDGDDDCSVGFFGDSCVSIWIFPWLDWHKGTFLERQNGGGEPPKKEIKRPKVLSEEKREEREQKKKHDCRKTEYLDPGVCDDCFKVRKHAATNAGLIVIVNATEPHSYVSGRILGKCMFSSKKQSIQAQPNQQEARDTPDIHFKEILKEMKDYEENGENGYRERWAVNDVKRKTGISTLALYGGVGYFTADANLGAFLQGQWSKKIKKLSQYRYYVAFTREGGAGPLAKLQMFIPLSKIERAQLYNGEYTISFTFDIRTEEGRKGLKAAINNSIFADLRIKRIKKKNDSEKRAGVGNSEAANVDDTQDLVNVTGEDLDNDSLEREDIEGITIVTSRFNNHKKTSVHGQIGLPFLGRARASTHKEKLHKRVHVARNNVVKDVKSKTYVDQHAWRHLNVPFFVGYGKKWWRFPSTHSHDNKAYQGIARDITTESGDGKKGPIERELRMQVSYSNDNVKSGKFSDKKNQVAKKIGLNTVNPEVPYAHNKKIGAAAAYYRLQLKEEDIRNLIEKVKNNEHLLSGTADELIIHYFGNGEGELDDPFNMARGMLKNRALSIAYVRAKTKYRLWEITRWIKQLDKRKVIGSKTQTSTLLAKISRAMGENQFVLQAVLKQIATDENQLGVYTLAGEEFRKKTYVADPVNNGREGEEIIDDLDEMRETRERKEQMVGGKTVKDWLNTYLIEEDF